MRDLDYSSPEGTDLLSTTLDTNVQFRCKLPTTVSSCNVMYTCYCSDCSTIKHAICTYWDIMKINYIGKGAMV